MRLLILTQIIDKPDSSLGFFHKWVLLLSEKYQETNVICLKSGEYVFPKNVFVHSLGKESATGSTFFKRFRYISRFYKLIWSLRRQYDTVLVHMNQEYVLLGGLFWMMLGKKIFLWRNHYDGSILTDIAAAFCKTVFCTSRFSYTAKYKKTIIMPVGVDVDSCKMDEPIDRIPRSILFLGRLDESKRPDVLLNALGILAQKNISFTATFVGGPSKSSAEYPEALRTQAEVLHIADRVTFVGAVPNTETYKYYRSHDIFVNCSRSGMLDKTIFKASACGCLVLVTSRDFADFVGQRFIFPENDSTALSEKLAEFLAISGEERDKLTAQLAGFIKSHNLPVLVDRLAEEIKS